MSYQAYQVLILTDMRSFIFGCNHFRESSEQKKLFISTEQTLQCVMSHPLVGLQSLPLQEPELLLLLREVLP